jgi:hypothetical protein
MRIKGGTDANYVLAAVQLRSFPRGFPDSVPAPMRFLYRGSGVLLLT